MIIALIRATAEGRRGSDCADCSATRVFRPRTRPSEFDARQLDVTAAQELAPNEEDGLPTSG
jgi:hypothetical protein